MLDKIYFAIGLDVCYRPNALWFLPWWWCTCRKLLWTWPAEYLIVSKSLWPKLSLFRKFTWCQSADGEVRNSTNWWVRSWRFRWWLFCNSLCFNSLNYIWSFLETYGFAFVLRTFQMIVETWVLFEDPILRDFIIELWIVIQRFSPWHW